MNLKTKRIIEVGTGEVKVSDSDSALIVNALGSCIAVIALDKNGTSGGIAHIMLPGRVPKTDSMTIKTRYSDDAIDDLIFQMGGKYSADHLFSCCIAGGANVLKRDDDMICESNISAVASYLHRKNIPIAAQSLGGIQRRRILFDIESGNVYCSIGDMHEHLLYSYTKERTIKPKTIY